MGRCQYPVQLVGPVLKSGAKEHRGGAHRGSGPRASGAALLCTAPQLRWWDPFKMAAWLLRGTSSEVFPWLYREGRTGESLGGSVSFSDRRRERLLNALGGSLLSSGQEECRISTVQCGRVASCQFSD